MKQDKDALQENASVISNAIWNLDSHGPVAYLELAIRHQDLENFIVFTANNEIFLRISGPKPGFADTFFDSIGLIPKVTLHTDVKYNGKVIGHIEAIHCHTTIYLYLYLLLLLGLVFLAIILYQRIADAKQVLEIRVTERTRELVAANTGLEKALHERIRAEEALSNSEEKYREIFNAPSDGILLHDASTGTILDANRAALDIYDYSYDELLKKNIGDLSSGHPPYDMEHGGQKVMLAMTEGPQLFEWQVKKQAGDLLWVEVALRSTEFSGQKYVIAVVRDISERKKAEEDLAAEQERLAVTLRSIGDGVITTDINGNIVLINKIAETLTGWSQEKAAGKALPDVFNIINERTRQPCANPVTKVLADGEVIELANHTILIAKEGAEYSIADSGAPIRDKKSEIIGVVLVFRDVTEEKRREDELVKGRKLESVGLLAGGIAHDFNNILTAILGNLNLALLYTDPKEKAYCLLQDAEKASVRARDLTQQLLTFAKGGEPVKELADIKDIIQDSAQFVLRGSNVRCDFHCGDDVWPVEIDQGQVSQVVQNIIINANQAMPEGGTIEISCSNVNRNQCHTLHLASREYLRVTIRDSGIGMAPSLLDKIFDPYFTTKQEGSGLGLAVSHSIISKHDGYIFASSEPGTGTTFTLYLPAETEKQPVQDIQQNTLDEVPGQGKIMVMDDDEMVRSISKNMLNHFGYDVLLAKDGKQAITFYNEARNTDAPVDLIIMDLTIPGGMGGKEAVQEIHRIDPKAKVIVSSGYSNDPIMSNYRAHGFLAAIVKPFQLHNLKMTIQNIL